VDVVLQQDNAFSLQMNNYEVSIEGITEAGESLGSFRRRSVHPILDKPMEFYNLIKKHLVVPFEI